MRFKPSFIQTTLVGGDPVETQVRVLLSSSYVRGGEMEGPTVWRGREITDYHSRCQLTIEVRRIQSHIERYAVATAVRNIAGIDPLICGREW